MAVSIPIVHDTYQPTFSVIIQVPSPLNLQVVSLMIHKFVHRRSSRVAQVRLTVRVKMTIGLRMVIGLRMRIGVRMRFGLRMRTELGVTRSYSTCSLVVHSLLLSIAID